MINLLISESEYFDKIAEISVNIDLSKLDERSKLIAYFKIISEELKLQIGYIKYESIMSSADYARLKDAIKNTLNIIINSKIYTINIATLNELNNKRYKCKQTLQTKYFPSIKLQEIKMGYSKTNES